MKKYVHLLYICMICWLSSCSSPSNVAYFQNAEAVIGMTLQELQPLRLRPKDKINIVVNSTDPMLMQQFNLKTATRNLQTLGSTYTPITSLGYVGNDGQILAYTVDEQGDIDFPVLGKLSVEGKTRQEVAEYLRKRLIERNLVKDPIITIEYVNMGVNVLGEVNRPGHVHIQKDYFTILDAIAAAGDLTINGQRENIMVFREIQGEDQTFVINLCDRQNVLSSPAFYLQQNDVVYVTPSPKKQREANSVGNAFNQPAFWMSLASLMTTITLFILR